MPDPEYQESNNLEELDDFDISDDLETLPDQSLAILAPHKSSTKQKFVYSWERGEGFAVSETQKEFQIFKIYLEGGTGRSIQYLQTLFNLSLGKIKQISERNNWDARIADYDRFILSEKLAAEKGKRQEEHKRKLEEYRQMQELLGRQLTIDAAKIATLANKTLDDYLENDRQIDIRDIPQLVNSAAKIAEIGKNLQGTALGVDELLVALEEADIEE